MLFDKSGTLVVPGGKRLYLIEHQRRAGADMVTLMPRQAAKVRFDVVDDTLDFTTLSEATIEWPQALLDAKKGESNTYNDGVSTTGYTGTRFQPAPTVIRREVE